MYPVNILFTPLRFRDREGIKKKQPKRAFTASFAKEFANDFCFYRFYYVPF